MANAVSNGTTQITCIKYEYSAFYILRADAATAEAAAAVPFIFSWFFAPI